MVLNEEKKIIKSENWRKNHPIWWYLLLGVFIICGTIITFICAVLIFINTSAGKLYIANQIQKHTQDRIEIQGVSGFVPTHLRIAQIEFKKPDIGVWLAIKQVQLNWSPWALLWGRVSIYSLTAQEVNLYKLPPKQVQTDLSQGESRLMSLPLAVDIQHLKIDQLFISEIIAKRNMYIVVDGQVKIRNFSNMMDVDTLKTAFMTRPKLRLTRVKHPADFQFGGKVSGSMERKNGTEYNTSLIPLHFSVILPEYPKPNSNDELRIYLGLGDKL